MSGMVLVYLLCFSLLGYMLAIVVCMCFMFVLICAWFMVLAFVLMSVLLYIIS